MGSVFKFKEFEVNQQGCAMKINTDGVLLGTMVEATHPTRILDVGSGTGVIALMLAQRFSKAVVDAVDIDDIAYARTQENFRQSKFSDRMHAYHGDFESAPEQYDLIVSNPPFYVNALHNPDDRKRLARHADLSFFQRLLAFAKARLLAKGSLQLILPVDLCEELKKYAAGVGFCLVKEVSIRSYVDTEVIRKVIVFAGKSESAVFYGDFVIYKEKGVYTEAYRLLLKPFFLIF